MSIIRKTAQALKVTIGGNAGSQKPGEILSGAEGDRYLSREGEIEALKMILVGLDHHLATFKEAGEKLKDLAITLTTERGRAAATMREIGAALMGDGDKTKALESLRHFIDAETSMFRVMPAPRVMDSAFIVGPGHPAFPKKAERSAFSYLD